jgi:hypothetical protein
VGSLTSQNLIGLHGLLQDSVTFTIYTHIMLQRVLTTDSSAFFPSEISVHFSLLPTDGSRSKIRVITPILDRLYSVRIFTHMLQKQILILPHITTRNKVVLEDVIIAQLVKFFMEQDSS